MTTSKTRKPTATAADTSAPTVAKAASKSTAIVALLKREGGATLEEMMTATGWQKHSVRGFMAGALRKKGLIVASEKTDQGRRYRVADEVSQ